MEYDIEDKGDIMDYLGLNFTRLDDGCIKLLQPQLIDQAITEVNPLSWHCSKTSPAALREMIQHEQLLMPFSAQFHYQ